MRSTVWLRDTLWTSLWWRRSRSWRRRTAGWRPTTDPLIQSQNCGTVLPWVQTLRQRLLPHCVPPSDRLFLGYRRLWDVVLNLRRESSVRTQRQWRSLASCWPCCCLLTEEDEQRAAFFPTSLPLLSQTAVAEHHQCLVVLRTPAASHVSEVVCVVVCVVEERTGGVLKCPAESVNLNNKTSFVI